MRAEWLMVGLSLLLASAAGCSDDSSGEPGCSEVTDGPYCCCEADMIDRATCEDGRWVCPFRFSWCYGMARCPEELRESGCLPPCED